jgi:(R,R)-butanediol dehydrogenase/meso-butanediol dehydrogenase/diacetyl reductase
MRALRFHAAHDIRVEEVVAPSPPAGHQVLVAPAICGICGTDVHEYAAGPLRTTVDPHPVTGGRIPQILGHEFAGTVVEVGPEVTSVSRGERVSIMPLLGCGECAVCRAGQSQLCDLRASVGLRHPWGGMADLALIDAGQVHPMPDALSWQQGAMIEPAAVSWAAVQVGRVQPGERVLVTGAGPIGALAALAAVAAGATVLVSEPNPSRARQVAALGFDVIDPRAGEPARDWSPDGFDVAIECSGVEVAIQGALAALRPGGRVVQTGVPAGPTTLDLKSLMLRGLTIAGSVGYPTDCWPEVMEAVASGRYPVERVITGEVGIGAAVSDGFDLLLDPAGDAVKVLVELQTTA